MAKFNKIYYCTKKSKNLNCYSVYIPKNDLMASNFNENDELDVIVNKDKIIIRKSKNGIKNEKTNK